MDVATWVETYRQAWEESDAEKAASLFTDDATSRSKGSAPTGAGSLRPRPTSWSAWADPSSTATGSQSSSGRR
jgi:hypothetical protein